MYWAVRIVKMYACRAWISNSKAVSTTVITNDAAANTSPMLALTKYQVAIVNTATRMWPANILPKSRIASVNGRMRMYWRISTGARRGRMNGGTPDGIMLLK